MRWNLLTCWRQRGAIIVFTAFLLPLLMACTGLAFDFGNLYIHHSRLQNAADAAALAGGAAYAQDQSKDSADDEARLYVDRNVIQSNKLGIEQLSDEKYQMQTVEGVTYYRVKLTEDVPIYFLKIFMPDTQSKAVSADAVVAIATGGGITDEMFKFAMCAAHNSSSTYNMNGNGNSNDCGIWFHTDDVTVDGDIMTNGKLMFDNSRNTVLTGELWADKDLLSSGSSFSSDYWTKIDGKDVYVTKTIEPSVWGKYTWGTDGKQETFTFVDENGTSFVKENISNLHQEGWQWKATATEESPDVHYRDEIDISVANNSSIREFIENIKDMSYADREKLNVYYDDSSNAYNFSSSTDTSHFPALCPQGSTVVPSSATSVDVWARWYKTIVVGGDIQVSFEKSPAPGNDDSAVIVSLNGNIHIPNNMNYKGILYAPNGKITIDGTAKVSGSIVAQKIIITTGGQYIETSESSSSHSSTSYSVGSTVKLASPKNLTWD
ncbi:MAG: pilus assembly protein [Selenomonadaceae bacterium]|nr:pilus assembly protein [Selenomonadaceae bacterium]